MARGLRALTTSLAALLVSSCQGGFKDRELCDGMTCSGHGTCWSSGTTAECRCDPGYLAQGLECLGGACSDDAGGGPEALFVVDSAALGSVDLGFDLDGIDTPTGCDGADVLCLGGPDDGVGGVDNRFGALFELLSSTQPDLDANSAIASSIAEGETILLFRVLDVDAWSDDLCTPTKVYIGHDPLDPPTVAAGRTYQVDARSLTGDRTDLELPVIEFVDDTAIVGGEYTAGPSSFVLPVPLGDGEPLSVTIRDARVRATISERGLGGGVIGGYVKLHELLEVARLADATRPFVGVLPLLLEGEADIDAIPAGVEIEGTSCDEENVSTYSVEGEGCGSIDYDCSPAGRCVEPANHFDAISIGVSFTAVPAWLDRATIYVAQ